MEQGYGTFTCEACGDTFTRSTPESEVDSEARELFGQDPGTADSLVEVCDDCFRKIMADSTK